MANAPAGTLRASVIVPAHNAAGLLPGCLGALLSQKGLAWGEDYEVIVVDDGSRDDTARVAAGLGVQVIVQPNAGPAAARNAGVRQARGAVVAFTDADCIPAGDWLVHLLEPFADPDVIGVKGVYRTNERGLTPRFVQCEYASKYARMLRQERIDFIDTYSAAYRRQVFVDHHGFDEIFPKPSVEDQEFSFRLARMGYRLVFQPLAAVYHRHDLNLREYAARKFGIGFWKAVMLNWLPEKTFSDSHTPFSQRLQLLLMAAMICALLLLPLWQPAAWLTAALGGLLLLSALPFLGFLARSDPPVLLAALPLLAVRALALGAGLVCGILSPPKVIRRPRKGLSLLERSVKRAVDVVGASLGLLLSLPVMLILAAAIRLDSPGRVLFLQVRAGENGRPFRMVKLRSMVHDAEQRLDEVLKENPLRGPVYKIPGDARVTRVGRFMRRWSLDELPQFWNVLKGEMSLVGPRPEEMQVVNQYDDAQRQRLLVKPGMTGPMQVAGRGRLDMDDRLRLEMDYVEHYSLWSDLKILIRSLPAVIKGDGAF